MKSQIEQLFAESAQDLVQQKWDCAQRKLNLILADLPDLAEAHANLAFLFESRGELDQALIEYQHSLALQPDNARTHVNYGALLTDLQRHDQAEASYRRAISLEPELPGAWANLGALLSLLRRDPQAELCLRTALSQDNDHAIAHFNLACLLLRQGRYAPAWPHWEKRPWYGPLSEQLHCPRWQGQALQDQRVLVVFEAGFGDMIQFCRYLPCLRAGGAKRVDLICQPALKRLLACLPGLDSIRDYDQPLIDWHHDWWIPALSLPCLFDTRLDSIPAQIPYLDVAPDLHEHWRSQPIMVKNDSQLRLGLVWRGNGRFQNDAQRSLPGLHTLAPLWQVPGVRFFSLQKGPGEEEAQEPPPDQPITALAPLLHDFADTAAAIAQMDLVLTVDTAVAHLSAALGKPCWVMLPAYMTDWRWLEQREDSPWYPGVMRLFRQRRAGDWTEVVAQLNEALAGQGI